MQRGLFAVVVAALTLLVPTSVVAQWRPLQDAPVGPAFDPAEDSGLVSPSSSDTAVLDATASALVARELPGQEPRTSRDTALMIVGGTAFLLGALIGDDAGGVLMVGGAFVGLVGLYQYLR